jgi:hypothetical protein
MAKQSSCAPAAALRNANAAFAASSVAFIGALARALDCHVAIAVLKNGVAALAYASQ